MLSDSHQDWDWWQAEQNFLVYHQPQEWPFFQWQQRRWVREDQELQEYLGLTDLFKTSRAFRILVIWRLQHLINKLIKTKAKIKTKMCQGVCRRQPINVSLPLPPLWHPLPPPLIPSSPCSLPLYQKYRTSEKIISNWTLKKITCSLRKSNGWSKSSSPCIWWGNYTWCT